MNKGTSRLIFSQNTWKHINIPKGHDPSWNSADMWYYASLREAAEARGFHAKRAEIIAEAVVFKRMYPGLMYDKTLEEDILKIAS
jgi:hypothetical protein